MYYFTFAYLFALVFFKDKIKDKYQLMVAMLPLFLIIILRYGVGADYFSYERIYHSINTNDFYGTMASLPSVDMLYKTMSFIALKIGLSYHIFAAIFIIVITLVTLKWIENTSPNLFLSVLLHFSMLFFYWNLSALRQGAVLSILTYVYFNGKKEFSIKEKTVATFILFFMHPSAIIVPAIYLISLFDWKKNYFIILLILAPLSRVVINTETLRLFSSVPYIGKFTAYLNYNPIKYLSSPSLLRVVFFGAIVWHYDMLVEKFPKQKIMINFSILSLILYFYLPVSMVIGTRVTIFGYFLLIVIFPMILSLYSNKKLYPIALAAVLSISLFSFYNEVSKLADRTGYMYSMHKLNFVTIFNKDLNDFKNKSSLDIQVNEKNKEWLDNNELNKKINKKYYESEVGYRDDLEYLSVYFPGNNMYGIINTEGDVLIKPISESVFPIYGNLREIQTISSSYVSKAYMPIDDSVRELLDYDDAIDIILTSIGNERELTSSQLFVEEIPVETLRRFEFLKDYNMGPVEEIAKHTFAINDHYSYLKLRTSYASYFLILKDNEVFVEKLYHRILPINAKGVIVATTKYSTEYINEDGKIIWYELNK